MPILFLILAMAFTGANVPFGKMIVQDMPVFLFLGVRFAIATLALWWLMRPADWQAITRIDRRGQIDVVVLAGVGSVLFTLFLLEGTKRTTAIEAGIISATLPAMVAILAVVVLRHRMTLRGIATIALSVMGLMVIQTTGTAKVATGHDAFQIASLTGNALVLVAVVCEAIFVLRSRGIANRLSPVALSFAVSATSLVLTVPLIAIELNMAGLESYTHIPVSTWGFAVWYALAASVFCTILWYAGVGRVASWQAGLATTAIPVTAIAVAALLLGEVLTVGQCAGAALVIGAIVIGAMERPSAVHADRSIDVTAPNRTDTPAK